MNAHPCFVCNESGHRASSCPCLYDDTKEGFYAGGSGSGSHNHDDDDDEACKKLKVVPSKGRIAGLIKTILPAPCPVPSA